MYVTKFAGRRRDLEPGLFAVLRCDLFAIDDLHQFAGLERDLTLMFLDILDCCADPRLGGLADLARLVIERLDVLGGDPAKAPLRRAKSEPAGIVLAIDFDLCAPGQLAGRVEAAARTAGHLGLAGGDV